MSKKIYSILALTLCVFIGIKSVATATDKITDKTIKNRSKLWDSKTVINDLGGKLAAYKGWIYYKKNDKGHYQKLFPGICPQWLPKHKGQQDRWFYVFLPVGYDGKSELWIGSTNGQYLGKVSEGMFHVNSTPVISPNGKILAKICRPLCTAAGNVSHVSVIYLNKNVEKASVEKFVFKKNGAISNLSFENNEIISFKFFEDGSERLQKINIKYPNK